MKFRDSDDIFLNEYFKAADAARIGERETCKAFMAYFKERMKIVTSDQIKTHFILKDLEEAITWYKILIYSGRDNYERDPRIKAMFSIAAKYIAANAPAEQKRKLMNEFVREVVR
jgi:hypothetical protein